ncbi:hypothetical protein LSM04_004316 [Trypanosoma melophagium]|uniref:uncharacterized protein n=1 Tax=Trypanosoma melophagium TaxID=715481 RepID=UPI00351A3685|nr:hypothetical protein LSM04_004316 [Trypanosoma melophagium]
MKKGGEELWEEEEEDDCGNIEWFFVLTVPSVLHYRRETKSQQQQHRPHVHHAVDLLLCEANNPHNQWRPLCVCCYPFQKGNICHHTMNCTTHI